MKRDEVCLGSNQSTLTDDVPQVEPRARTYDGTTATAIKAASKTLRLRKVTLPRDSWSERSSNLFDAQKTSQRGLVPDRYTVSVPDCGPCTKSVSC